MLSFVLVSNLAIAQMKEIEEDSLEIESPIYQPKRVEFEYETDDTDFHVVNANEKGILVVQERIERATEGFMWKIHLLDSALDKVWSKDILVQYGWTYIGYDFNQSDFLLLFSTSEYDSKEMLVMKIAQDGDNIVNHEITTALPLDLSHFEVVGDGLIFGGTSNGRPAIVYYNLNVKRAIVLPGIYNNKSSIVSIETSDRYRLFSVSVSEKTTTNDYTISLKVFTSAGDLIFTSQLETELEKSLVDAVSTYFKNGEQYVSGTYSNRKTDKSLGFYLAKLKGGEQEFIKYHPYADLYNFFSYMRDKQKDRVKKRIDRKKIRGKKIKLNYRLLVHEIVRRGDEFILIGEAYYPKHGSNPYSNSMIYDPFMASSAQNNVQERFLGYQYTHAVVVGFNEDGEILWDNSFEINDVLTFSLEKNIQVNFQDDKIVMLYIFEGTISSRVLSKGDAIQGKAVDSIKLEYENDTVKDSKSEVNGLMEWYGKNFFAYGDQKIRNTVNREVETNRKVFYINKIALK
ncbi:MAG: hypothetical protein JXR07_14465 [Reichenbachiella sp.]